ncbi:hypothetical protein [Qingshengfaniella alkalisoli]|uniref:Uncharacterized protein n=1 Tax=Qingshengfaniella alkalisoli TaxID=2599296 RepID=A0A5B8IB35_9RHOB|nr:hypothetical protein FPZ52_12865 [Qingshengfaniella alkalisoli]
MDKVRTFYSLRASQILIEQWKKHGLNIDPTEPPYDLRSALRTIRQADLHLGADYTPYEGMEVKGWPVSTYLRGVLLCRDGSLAEDAPRGAYLSCGTCYLDRECFVRLRDFLRVIEGRRTK